MQMPIESLNLLMLNVGKAQHNGDWNWRDVSSPFTRIYYVTKGEAWLHLPKEMIKLRPHFLYIIPAYTLHSYECHSVFEHYYLHVYEGFKNETNVFEMYNFPTEVKAGEGDEQLLKQMTNAHPEAQLPESNPKAYDNVSRFTDYVKRYNALGLWEKMRLRGATLLLFSRFMEHAVPRVQTKDERMIKVLDYIHNHIDEEIDIGMLSDIACVSKPYFIRLFKDILGMSPLQYVIKKKVSRAQLLLMTEEISVKEAAYRLGFNDHSYFIRQFRKVTGVTPLEYRTRMR